MGCDIHSFAEKRNKKTGDWEKVKDAFSLDDFDKKYLNKEKGEHPFDWRNYSMFAFLAGVRNYDCCEPLSEPKGLPSDVSKEVKSEYGDGVDWHSESFLTGKELLNFDYDKSFWNRRVSKQTSPTSWTGAGLAEKGEGKILTYRENLGDMYFLHLKELKQLGNPEYVRIVFWFDN